jgi:hypothetical protein
LGRFAPDAGRSFCIATTTQAGERNLPAGFGLMNMSMEFRAKEGEAMNVPELIWQCEEWRAGKMYERKLFDTKEDAEMFVRKLSQVAPDLIFKIAPVNVQQVWN